MGFAKILAGDVILGKKTALAGKLRDRRSSGCGIAVKKRSGNVG